MRWGAARDLKTIESEDWPNVSIEAVGKAGDHALTTI